MKVFGITGWSGGGKTTLIERLIPLLRTRGMEIGIVKHADSSFDIDLPGKDSHRFRQAGGRQIVLSSSRRRAEIYELKDGESEGGIADLLQTFRPACDLVLVEGYKNSPLPKLEVWRAAVNKPPLILQSPPAAAGIAAMASDDRPPPLPPSCALLPLSDAEAVAEFVVARAIMAE